MEHAEKLRLAPPASEADIGRLRRLGNVPEAYIDFLRQSDGAIGPVGRRHLIVYSARDAVETNTDPGVIEAASGLFVFGSDGGGEWYAFDTRHPALPIVEIDPINLGIEEPTFRASSLAAFFEYLYHN